MKIQSKTRVENLDEYSEALHYTISLVLSRLCGETSVYRSLLKDGEITKEKYSKFQKEAIEKTREEISKILNLYLQDQESFPNTSKNPRMIKYYLKVKKEIESKAFDLSKKRKVPFAMIKKELDLE